MSALSRFTQFIFGSTAASGRMSQFGSLKTGSPVTDSGSTITPAIVQGSSGTTVGAQYAQGLDGAIIGNNAPAVQDLNGMFNLTTYQLAYIFQNGIPEYDTNTTYYTNHVCRSGAVVYQSIADNNQGNTPASSPSDWVVFAQVQKQIVQSSSSGTFATTSTIGVGVTNLSITTTVKGNPVEVGVVSDGTTNAGYIGLLPTGSISGAVISADFVLQLDGTNIFRQTISGYTTNTSGLNISIPVSSIKTITTPSAGSHTWAAVVVVNSATTTISVNYATLYVKELY